MVKGFRRFIIISLWIALLMAILYTPNCSFDKKSINIFTWGDLLEPAVIADFEKKTGIKVHLNYYSSNEELMVKMKATEGRGYDLIIPTDYAVRSLVKEGVLQKIEKSKILSWQDINPILLDQDYDPKNNYSIPFVYEIYALGINKNDFPSFTPSWKMIFDPKVVNYKISMLNDPLDCVAIASLYLFGPVSLLSENQVGDVKNLLLTQKKWVEAYADTRGDYFLATKNCSVVLASSSYLQKSIRKFPFISMVVPQEGTFITIENLCIPKLSEKKEATYAFINHITKAESVLHHYQSFGFFPAVKHPEIDKETDKFLKDKFRKYHSLQNIMPQKELRELWLEIKTE